MTEFQFFFLLLLFLNSSGKDFLFVEGSLLNFLFKILLCCIRRLHEWERQGKHYGFWCIGSQMDKLEEEKRSFSPHSSVCLLFMINEQQTIARLAFSSDVFSGEGSDSYGTFHRARMKNMREVTRSWYFFYPDTFQTSCLHDRCKLSFLICFN